MSWPYTTLELLNIAALQDLFSNACDISGKIYVFVGEDMSRLNLRCT